MLRLGAGSLEDLFKSTNRELDLEPERTGGPWMDPEHEGTGTVFRDDVVQHV